MRKVFVEHKFVGEDKDLEWSNPENVCWGTYPDDRPSKGDWYLYVESEEYENVIKILVKTLGAAVYLSKKYNRDGVNNSHEFESIKKLEKEIDDIVRSYHE